MRLDLSMMRPGSQETAQTAFDGARYYRTATGVYLKDFGRGDSDDSAKLYSGQMLDFDGVDDKIVIGDISATCNTLTMTINSATITEALIQLAAGKSLAISGGTITPTGLTNAIICVDGVIGSTVTADYHRIVVTFNDENCTDVQIGYNGSTYFDGFIGNVQLWDAAFDADDVAWDYANCHLGRTADNCPGTDLVTANLKGFWPLIEGAGDVAYDHSGNSNPGTLTNFPVDGTGWSNADALDDPIVCQTALIEWALKTSNNACVPLDTAASTNFARDHGEVNWNGRSYADIGNGTDVSPSTAVIIEGVCSVESSASMQYLLGKGSGNNYRLRITGGASDLNWATKTSEGHVNYTYLHDVVDIGLFHFVCVFYEDNYTCTYKNGILDDQDSLASEPGSLVSGSEDLILGTYSQGSTAFVTGQLPCFKMIINAKAQAIIDDDLAAWVTKQYAKAQRKYN